MTFQHETHKDLPAAFQALEAGDNRTFHQCIHRIHGAANILNLQKLINISHQLEITPVSDDSKPEILQLLNSVKEHIAELDQEIAVFCQKMTNSGSHNVQMWELFTSTSYIYDENSWRICSPCWSSVAAPGITCGSAQPLIFIGLPGIIIPRLQSTYFSPEFVAI